MGRAPFMTGHGWPEGSIGRPHRGQSGRPADRTDSACFENAITWSWLSQKRTDGASSAGGASLASPAAHGLAARTNTFRAAGEARPLLPLFHPGAPRAAALGAPA